MSIGQVQLENSYLSLRRPAWTSTLLNCISRLTVNLPSKSKKRKFAFIRSRKGIYDRIEIISENSTQIVVKFVSKSHRDLWKVKYITEVIKKSDILERRNYKDNY